MKKLIAFVFSMFFAALAFAQSAKDDFTGKWKTEDGVTITISNNKGKFSGVDPKGRPTLYNVRFEKNEWKGNVENHETGQKGNCELYLEGKKLKIVAHKGIFSKTFYWVKQ
ncbi:hypothetical protein EGY05_11795 [Chryseobacterium arthrosphaerae]|uniref:DUF2147 domain-containing protein n=1 Tax=Chryseobacterium arthrosphaerae TaxID=651561 RepID=A0A1B8ZRS2_9FLAO|nr:hypothetical protein [Chryseobacterium arthrosphaerae]AYZ12568.1 hypothetical protein EGY05_11795 [Chryseobacterium arthrosphaerae]OCA74285.1 hypothetical protein BBI00_08010 [Chryseobacterium arthrosphaerae]